MRAAASPSIVADVLVLGAGPGGATAGLHLERLGISSVMLEARSAVATRPNVVDLSPDAVASIRRAGLESLLDGRMGPSLRGEAGASLALGVLENGARAALEARGVPVHYGARVAGLEQHAGGLQHVLLADGRVAAGRYVINATGGRSGIEQQLGMDLRFHGDWSWFGAARTPHVSELESGTRVGGLFGLRSTGMVEFRDRMRPSFETMPLPPELERWRSTMWYGWQNPVDGLSMFQPIAARDIAELTPAELGARILAPARAHGMQEVLDPPRLIRAESASVEQVRSGAVLAIGDAAGRAHPKHMVGTQLALLDAERAARVLHDALRAPAQAERHLSSYEAATQAAHAAFGHDGTKVIAADPLRGAGRDMIELDGLAAWPGMGPIA